MTLIERAEQIAAAPMDAAQEIEELHAKLRDADFRERGLHEALRRETANTRGAVAALRKFAVSDSEFVDDYEGGEPSDDIQVCVGITRAEAAAIRAIVGGQ